MRRARRFLTRTAVIATTTLLLVHVMSACSSKSSLVGPGGECFLATDCAPGLVCVEQANKSRACSDDLARVAGRPPAEAGGEDDASDEGGDAQPQTDAPVVDSGQDTSAPPDTSTPPQDSAADG